MGVFVVHKDMNQISNNMMNDKMNKAIIMTRI